MRLVSIFIFLLLFPFLDSYAQTALEIIKKSEDNLRGNSSHSQMKITIVRPKWKRTMGISSWSKGDQYAMILITAPAKEKGTVFLKRGKEVWNWVPSIERTIKLPPSMMMQSWMGTDLTNDDLVRESSIVKDYTHKILKDSTISGHPCWKIKLTPKPNAPVVWGKIYTWVTKKDYLQIRVEFYDEDDYLINIMEASNIKKMGGRTIPATVTLIPIEKKGHKTIMEYESILFDQKIDDNFFTIQNMKKIR